MEVLVIAAHPDDEVLGLGGTICKLSSKGHNVHLLILTDGSSCQYKNSTNIDDVIEQKRKETSLCAGILGIKTIDYGPFPDMKLDTVSHSDVNDFICGIIGKYKPEIVFTHFYGDVNKDHRCAFESTMVSTRPVPGQIVKKVLLYRTPSSTEWNAQNNCNSFCANVFVDVTRFESRKIEAISFYKTELRDYPHPRSLEAIKLNDSSCGNSIGTLFAECFVLVRDIED